MPRKKKTLIVTAFTKTRHHLMAKEDLDPRTTSKAAALKIPLVKRDDVRDELLNKKFRTRDAAVKAANDAGFDALTYQAVSAKAKALAA